MDTRTQEKLLAILDYWHKVEFFIPYGLDQHLSDLKEWQAKRIYASQLDDPLDSEWLGLDVPPSHVVTGYYLNLGIFDKSSIASLCEHLKVESGQPVSAEQTFEDEARTDLEGITCFARLELDKHGYLVPDSISISTAPWAIGQTMAHGLSGLGYDAFECARDHLKGLLENFLSEREECAGQPVGAPDLQALHRLLCEWAGFTPDADQPLAVIEARISDAAEQKKQEEPAATGTPAQAEEDEDDEEPVVEELGILNSFYIQDIERAINSVRAGNVPEPLLRYLLPLPPDERLDLYTDSGRQAIIHALRPGRTNAGHWFADPRHPMSLMQQFALNQIGQALQHGGIFSVNGPPGTGKTTLLRDIFADNITRRARVLARLESPSDAFVKTSVRVHFKGGDSVTLWPLIEALTGFEMVVASSNNAAVENISVDLVKRKEQHAHWSDVGYLQPVAHNLAVQGSKRTPVSPVGDQMPWGLISGALGNSKNRRHFNSRFSVESLKTNSPEVPLTIWQWFKGPAPRSFADARDAFKVADQAVTDALAKRERLAQLLESLADAASGRSLAKLHEDIAHAATVQSDSEKALQTLATQREALKSESNTLKTEQQLLERTKPVWWARLLRIGGAGDWVGRDRANATAQLDILVKDKLLKSKADTATQALSTARELNAQLDRQLTDWQRNQQALRDEHDALLAELGPVVLPQTLEDLELAGFQKDGLWHDQALAALRSELFACALRLQEAWVHAVGQDGGRLRSNLVAILKVLQNRIPENLAHTLPIWQNLFMVVPVVSSTFASFARQFQGLQPGSLGWVFIDEAGQAVPQAAVGALWRAKRCVVVGDPLQIEPVFTLPGKLIDALGASSPFELSDDYAPHRVSVQRLADQANRYGTYASLDGERLWIGSPLRVHRRCHDPMFGLANLIAYDGKMVFGLGRSAPPEEALIDLDSCWVDIAGSVEHKQVVPEQVEFVTSVIRDLYLRDGSLPGLYVISPFKAVREALRRSVLAESWPPTLKRRTLQQWVSRNIGTVHTFQGKENESVFMVLGADRENAGGAQWAASKPNLLNVALTRAKHRFYLVGDFELWGALAHFSEAAKGKHALPRVGRNAFRVIQENVRTV